MLDLVVEGNAYLEGRLNKCCIGIENGKIVTIKKILKGEQQFDFGDKLILPGGIDIHVHFREPGNTNKEDFLTGTMAAAFGGITCVLDMPNTNPPVSSKKHLIDKLGLVRKKAYVDFGLYSSITPKSDILDISRVCSGFKIYLASTTGELLFTNLETLPKILQQIYQSNRVGAIHAESQKIILEKLKYESPSKSLHDHLRKRPNKAELEAVSNIIKIISKLNEIKLKNIISNNTIENHLENAVNSLNTNCSNSIHLCHISTAESIDIIRNNKKRYSNSQKKDFQKKDFQKKGYQKKDSQKIDTQKIDTQKSNYYIHDTRKSNLETNDQKEINEIYQISIPRNYFLEITTEVTPHHLLLNKKFNGGTYGKVNPPLRTSEDQRALWQGLIDGTIDILASDHAPHTIDEKNQKFEYAPSGMPGVETMLPLMMTYVKKNRISIDRICSVISEKPAEMFGLPKGKLKVGYDGDLTVFDLYKQKPIKANYLHSKCGWTPYERMEAIFPKFSVVRGNIVMKDDNLEADPGVGKFYN